MSAELLTYRMGILPNVHSGAVVPQCENEINSRWHELFGTPEKAARTIADACTTDPGDGCIGCPAFGAKCGCGGYDALLEWLRGDA